MKIKSDKLKFKLEVFTLLISIIFILLHLYKIIFKHNKLSLEVVLTLLFFTITIIILTVILNSIYIKILDDKLYISTLNISKRKLQKDIINIKDIKKYGFTSDLKLGKNKYDIALLTKNKKIIIPVDQFKNKDIMKLLNTIEDKTNMKPYGFVFKLFDKHRFKSYSKVSTKQTLLNTKVPVYVIAADRDTIVNSVYNFEEFKEACKDDETKKFLLVKDRFHRPNLTLEGAKYDNDTNEEYYRLYLENKCEIPQEKKDEFYGGLDYNKLVEMDEVVMSSIASFLEENLSN